MDITTLPFFAALGSVLAIGFLGFVFILGLIFCLILIDGYCLRYLIEFWGSLAKGRNVRVSVHPVLIGIAALFASMLFLFISDVFIIGSAATTFILSLFIDNPSYAKR